MRETHDFQSLPVLVRPNSILILGGRSDRPDYDYGEGVTLAGYELAIDHFSTVIVPTITGEPEMIFHVHCEDAVITVQREGSRKPWQFLLAGIASVAVVEGDQATTIPEGTQVAVAAEQDGLRVAL